MMGLNIRDGLMMTGKIAGGSVTSSQRQQPAIEERAAGPLLATAVSRFTGPEGEDLATKPVMALCRCGRSKTKPYCDGSHNEIGFSTEPLAGRTLDGSKVFEGKQISVHYHRSLCSHAGECGKRLKDAFDTDRDPWIVPDNATPRQIRDVVMACPSGALTWSEPGGDPRHIIGDKPGISIERNGPYRVTKIPLKSGVRAEGASLEKYVLCRCGESRSKPFCDGTHANIGWSDQST